MCFQNYKTSPISFASSNLAVSRLGFLPKRRTWSQLFEKLSTSLGVIFYLAINGLLTQDFNEWCDIQEVNNSIFITIRCSLKLSEGYSQDE